MNFLNPFVLIGLAAGAIPFILHLLNLRKLKTVEFSTLRFLKELQKTKIRKLKLRQIILLILRTLIIILAVMAFARPTMEGTIPGFETYAKTSAVILLDNSFSMDVSDEYGNRLTQARNSARSILNGFGEGDEAAIILMTESDRMIKYDLSRNMEYLKEELSKVQVSNQVSDLTSSLKIASVILGDAVNLNKEVYIITDAGQNIFNNYRDSSDRFMIEANLFVVPVSYNSKSGIDNLTVDSLNLITRIFQSEKLIEMEASVRNYSAKDADGIVLSLLFNGERVAQRSIDIGSGENKTVPIAAAPKEEGIYSCSVEIEGDAVYQDNRRYFGFIIPEKPKVALIGPAPKTSFLEIALNGKKGNNTPARINLFKPEELSTIDVSSYDVLMLAGGPYKQSDLERITNYLKEGGSAFIFADEETNKEPMLSFLNNIELGNPGSIYLRSGKSSVFSSVDKMHPVFEGVFKGTTDRKAIVESPKIYISKPISGGQEIIGIPGGAFLSESRPGLGKAFYCAVSPVMSWSSLPFTGLFPTLMFRSIVYLSARENMGANIQAGETLVLNLPKRFASGGNFRIIDPEGTESYLQAAVLPKGAVLSFPAFPSLGVYSVFAPDGQPVSIVSVNPPSSESRPGIVKEPEFRDKLEDIIGNENRIVFIDDNRDVSSNVDRARAGTELWQFFLLAALLCALAEMIVEKNTKNEIAD